MKFEPIAYASHYGGRCHGCADENGVCPTTGMPCDPDERLMAAAHCLKAWQYGIEHGHMDNPFPPAPAPTAEPIPSQDQLANEETKMSSKADIPDA